MVRPVKRHYHWLVLQWNETACLLGFAGFRLERRAVMLPLAPMQTRLPRTYRWLRYEVPRQLPWTGFFLPIALQVLLLGFLAMQRLRTAPENSLEVVCLVAFLSIGSPWLGAPSGLFNANYMKR